MKLAHLIAIWMCFTIGLGDFVSEKEENFKR